MMEKINNKSKIFNILIIILLLIQPFSDVYKNYYPEQLQIFGISIIELINMGIIFLLILITFLKRKELFKDKKKKVFIICLVALYVLYLVLHCVNILSFDSTIYDKSEINIYKEFYYMFRALLLPLILMLCIYLNDFSKELFYKIITILTFMISGLIVVSNVFNFSFIAYSVENKVIVGNIFDWFTYTDTYVKPLTSKGLFFSANQVSNLLFILLPVNLYYYIKKKKFINVLLLFFQILSMIMLGTKTSTYGQLLILGFVLAISIVMSISKRVKFKDYIKGFLPLYLLILISIFFTYNGPLMLEKRNNNLYNQTVKDELVNDTDENNSNNDTDENNSNSNPNNINLDETHNPDDFDFVNFDCHTINDSNEEELYTYLKANFYNYKVNKYFIENYALNKDLYFWCNIYHDNMKEVYNSREIKTAIFARIQERNNNNNDKYLGMGYTLNMMILETDYNEIYYQFGIIGLILFVGPYIVLFGMGLIYLVINIKKKFNYENVLLLLSVFCGIVVPHLSGHTHSNVFVTFPLALTTIMMYKSLKEDK